MIDIDKIKRLDPVYINRVAPNLKKPDKITDDPNSPDFWKGLPWYFLYYADDLHNIVNKIPEASKELAVIKYGLKAICFTLEKMAKYYRIK